MKKSIMKIKYYNSFKIIPSRFNRSRLKHSAQAVRKLNILCIYRNECSVLKIQVINTMVKFDNVFSDIDGSLVISFYFGNEFLIIKMRVHLTDMQY